jgi:ATP-binding cassette subfamily B protein
MEPVSLLVLLLASQMIPPRFYAVDGGQITVDGHDIRALTLASLQRQIGIVQQDVLLFFRLIGENIAYGNLEASEPEVWAAARQAHLDTFIQSLPEGLDTLIGERGREALRWAEAAPGDRPDVPKEPTDLILDEATSALDTQTEQVIQQSLAELPAGRTTLTIAHRLATIKHADRIVVVTESGISEQGAHQELIRSGGIYSRLHQAQFGS